MNEELKTTIVPVVLCGGAGSRLWPMSRDDKPKQFHALLGQQSLLSQTLDRMPEGPFEDVVFAPPCIIGNAALQPQLETVLADRPQARLVLEPAIRDTAPAIAACTLLYEIASPDSCLLVLPSDALIRDQDAFRSTVVKAARSAANTDAIMTIGVSPIRPETQYGYIETGAPLAEGLAVQQFREKPDADNAQRMLDAGGFLWNAGMFLFRAGRMGREFRTLQPQIWDSVSEAVRNARIDGRTVWLEASAFGEADRISIDYAIMEKTDNIGVVPATFDWDDLGSWPQLFDHSDTDKNGNAISGDVIALETQNSYVRARDAVVAVAGVENLIVVVEDGKVLVTQPGSAHLVKQVTQSFKERYATGTVIDNSTAAIRRWLFETCLPFWVEHGVDRTQGGVHEALDFGGAPAPLPVRRLRVLPRQIYSFAHAEALGWAGLPDGVLEALFETLTTTGWHASEGGFIHHFNPDGTIRDDRRDAYDQCFALLAFSWLHRVRGWPEARHWADRTLDWMDHSLPARHGGYLEDCRGTRPRRANPHMHFLEAMLAWHDATGEDGFLDRAEAIVDLFQNHFFDFRTGTLTEFFTDDWAPVTDRSATTAVEPGHHYEWAWLLLRFLEKRPRAGLEDQARLLFATARAVGHHAKTGAVADAVQPDGTNLSERARLWPQTEALKAAIAFEKRGLWSAAGLRHEMVEVLVDHYLAKPVAGGWIDAIDTTGQNVANDMPSSTLYHIVGAAAELFQAD